MRGADLVEDKDLDLEKQRAEESEKTGTCEETQAEASAETTDQGGKAEMGQEKEDTACGEDTASKEEKEPEKKGFFGKRKDKKDPRDTQIEELTDRLKRNMAEFDNYRKRTEKEKSAMYEIGAKDIVEKILPVVDNFERGLAAVPEEEKGLPFAEGMEMIYKQLMKTLDEIGVKPIEALGKEFDPNLHNAVMHVDDENLGENIVASELQKGYTYRDSVVRHSMVQVAN